MAAWVRETLVTCAAALLVGGVAAGVVLPALPEARRGPWVLWGILLGSAALVAGLRRRRPPRP
jgi:hypothetical protein